MISITVNNATQQGHLIEMDFEELVEIVKGITQACAILAVMLLLAHVLFGL